MTIFPKMTRFRNWPVFALLFVLVSQAWGEAYHPMRGSEVLETIRSSSFGPVDRELRKLRARLKAAPTNLVIASQFARLCLERSRSEADPRYLGRAQSALAPWWNDAVPPVEALVLRATLKQSQHDFRSALTDLDLALRLDPRHAQAWLTRVAVLTVLGDYAEARRSCVPLARLAPGLISLTAAASVTTLNGEAEHGCTLLKQSLEASPAASATERAWALTILAETTERLGKVAEAEGFYRQAMERGQHDPYLLGAYADFLIDQNRAQDAVGLLKHETRADGLLLRLTLAESMLKPRPVTYAAQVALLQARFEAGHLRGDFVHQREEALFNLQVLKRPVEALRLAQENWQIQHEPADLKLLLSSALAAHQLEAARPALDFIRTNHLEAVELAALSRQLPAL